uniref:Uncharacterized protein n=1 Tax=Anguilla anguilla TaxID=7936 RepID=A0A0E9SYL9_ANGAN
MLILQIFQGFNLLFNLLNFVLYISHFVVQFLVFPHNYIGLCISNFICHMHYTSPGTSVCSADR